MASLFRKNVEDWVFTVISLLQLAVTGLQLDLTPVRGINHFSISSGTQVPLCDL
jgi:hypothetical protein